MCCGARVLRFREERHLRAAREYGGWRGTRANASGELPRPPQDKGKGSAVDAARQVPGPEDAGVPSRFIESRGAVGDCRTGGGSGMTGVGRHERAVANTLGFAQEAASRGDFKDALEWLGVVEFVDGVLPPGWERTRAVWRRGRMPAEVGGELPAARRQAGGSWKEAG